MKIRVGVVGFRGYSGAEAVRLLTAHPHCEAVLLEHRADAGDDAKLRHKPTISRAPAGPESVGAAGLKAVLLATPPDVSMDLAPKFLEAGAAVIDLSGAFRLRTAERYTQWYKEEHTAPALFECAAYGLPEYNRECVRQARLVSNPGCYPTAANLAIRPLVAAGIVDRSAGIVCDAKSGISGAGRKPALKTSFCEATENFSAYSILKHRHVPEVLLTSGLDEREFTFTAQLLPVDRRAFSTAIYFRLRANSVKRGDHGDLREAVCRRSCSSGSMNPGSDAGSARRGAHEFLRHRRGFRSIERTVRGRQRDR